MLAKPEGLSRAEIKAVFRRHRGAKAKLAKELGVGLTSISDWMGKRGRSKRVDAAIRQRAAELITAERRKASGGGA